MIVQCVHDWMIGVLVHLVLRVGVVETEDLLDVRQRLALVLAAAGERRVHERRLASLNLHNALFCRCQLWQRGRKLGTLTNCAFDDVARDEDRLALTETMDAIDGLLLDRLVPPRVHHEDVCMSAVVVTGKLTVRHGQVETNPAGFE